MPEIRVPPYGSEQDDWAINERYDAFKFFEESGRQVGVAIEMEGWQINNDLLKFRRGFSRGRSARASSCSRISRNLAKERLIQMADVFEAVREHA
jgi:hypothetical protein